jgi:hypothetical protein
MSTSEDRAREVEPKLPDRSLGELFSELSDNFSSLVRDEIELAKVELKTEVTKAGKGGGLLGAGAFAAWMAVVLLSFAAAWALDAVMPTGLAFLIVGAIWAIAGAVLALQGRKKLKQVKPVPEQTIETLQEDKQWAQNLRN